MLEERDGDDDLEVEDLFDELGDDDLLACEVDDLFDGEEEALLDVEVLLDVEAPLLVRPEFDVEGLVVALLEAEAPDPRPACDVDGRVPPFPAVLKFPLLTLLLTRLEVFLVFLL